MRDMTREQVTRFPGRIGEMIGPEKPGCPKPQRCLTAPPPWSCPTSSAIGKALFAEVERNDLEGIVAKMQASPYMPQTTWYKIKNPAYSQATGRKEIFEQMRKR